jgi:serine protease Do
MKRSIAGRYLGLLLAALACISALTGCVLPGANSPSTTSLTTVSAPITSSSSSATVPNIVIPQASPIGSQVTLSLPDFGSIIAEVRPSVVAIATESSGTSLFGSSFTQQGAGSGWIIDKNGMIVTNNHVVEGATNITVTLEDGRTFPADAVHTDPIADLAVIKINAQNLPALQVGDSSKLYAGQWVVAIGNSLGMGISATKGIVSALGVSLSVSAGESLTDLIQTDAAINPGNSGGPLVNLQGQVVGINSVKVSQVGVEGMGYAISIEEALPVINDLIKNGYVARPYLGASLYTVDSYVIRRYRLSVSSGVLVTDVAAGSPAAKAGIQPGDVITAVDDKAINDDVTLTQTINSDQIGQKIKITYWRGKSQGNVSATLAQSPPPGQ